MAQSDPVPEDSAFLADADTRGLTYVAGKMTLIRFGFGGSLVLVLSGPAFWFFYPVLGRLLGLVMGGLGVVFLVVFGMAMNQSFHHDPASNTMVVSQRKGLALRQASYGIGEIKVEMEGVDLMLEAPDGARYVLASHWWMLGVMRRLHDIGLPVPLPDHTVDEE